MGSGISNCAKTDCRDMSVRVRTRTCTPCVVRTVHNHKKLKNYRKFETGNGIRIRHEN